MDYILKKGGAPVGSPRPLMNHNYTSSTYLLPVEIIDFGEVPNLSEC